MPNPDGHAHGGRGCRHQETSAASASQRPLLHARSFATSGAPFTAASGGREGLALLHGRQERDDTREIFTNGSTAHCTGLRRTALVGAS
eukprot:222138-Pyramimonas_sp.AAC.1